MAARVSIDASAARDLRAREGTVKSDVTAHDLNTSTASGSSSGIADRYAQALKEESTSYANGFESGGPTQKLESSIAKGPSEPGDMTESADSEFDWDESDDSELDEAEREEKKRLAEKEKREEHQHHVKRAKRLRKVYLAFMRLARPIRTALMLIIGSGAAIIPALVVWLKFPNTNPSLKPHILIWSIWASVAWAAACVTSIVVDIIPALVIKIILLVYGSTPESSKTQVELWMGVKWWTKLALGLTWDWVAIIVILNTFFSSERASGQLDYFDWVIKVNAALFGTGLVMLVEKILLQLVKINFHRTSLQGRLEENARALWALDKLAAAKDIRHSPKNRRSGMFGARHSRNASRLPSLDGTPGHRSGRSTPGKPLGEDPVVVDIPVTPLAGPGVQGMQDQQRKGLFHRKSKISESAAQGVDSAKLEKELNKAKHGRSGPKRPPHSRLSSTGNIIHARDIADQLTHALANATLKGGAADGSGSKGAFGSTHSAKKLARKLFEGLDEDRGGVLTKSEFEPFFRNASDAEQAFKLFDKDGNGDIDKKEMRNAVSRIYRERKALATSLKDMSSAVAKLDAVLIGVALLVVLFIWLFILNPSGTSAELVPIATIVLGFSFVFGNSMKNLFESMLFIFSVHPYDVGDLVFIDDQPLMVMEFGLFSSVFKRVDGQVIIAPHSLLSTSKNILNVRRSGPMWETTNIQMAFNTPLEVIHEFRQRMRQYVADNPREWRGGFDCNVDFMENQNRIQFIIAMEHRSNWQDWGARWDRRTLLMKQMKRVLDDLNVTYSLPPQPVTFMPKGGPAPFRPAGRGPGFDGSGSATAMSGGRPILGVDTGNAGLAARGPQSAWTTGQIPTLRVGTAQSFRPPAVR